MSSELRYTDEKNALALMAMLKKHGISRVIASPGGTNFQLVGSMQNDSYFKLFSAVDERHAAYLACGMALEANEPVVLSCTGATASRNYYSGLTEAYYRKLPILVVTSSQPDDHFGQLFAQMTDRHHPPLDVVRYQENCPVARTDCDMRECARRISKAILELERHGGGPVHLNLVSSFSSNFGVRDLPDFPALGRVSAENDNWPTIPQNAKVLVWIGAHRRFSAGEERTISDFAEKYDAVVIGDHTSNYHGVNGLASSLLCSQGIGDNPNYRALKPDLIVHVGEVSGDIPTTSYLECQAEVWRVNPDGEFRDRLYALSTVFEMTEMKFFSHYASLEKDAAKPVFAKDWIDADMRLRKRIPDVPFSNIWIAGRLCERLPDGCVCHSGILNSLRSRNMTPIRRGIEEHSAVGGFGIDGCVSSLVGASLVNAKRMCFGVFGDLSFFYDLNAIGNRHIGSNLRILVVNNGAGAEFNHYSCGASVFGAHTNDYIAAGGHFGNKSPALVRHLAEDLGFAYLAATDKESFLKGVESFVGPSENPIIFECFTDMKDEADALKSYCSLDSYVPFKSRLKSLLPQSVKSAVRKVI